MDPDSRHVSKVPSLHWGNEALGPGLLPRLEVPWPCYVLLPREITDEVKAEEKTLQVKTWCSWFVAALTLHALDWVHLLASLHVVS